MRIGNSYSKSYRQLRARRAARKAREVAKLCRRLDKLVCRAESYGPATVTRERFMVQADKVREKLAQLDH